MAANTTTVAPPERVPPGSAPAGRRSALRRDGRYAGIFLGPSLAGLALFTLVPTAMALGISLFDWPVFGERKFLGGGNYSQLLNDPVFRRVVLNTALFVVLYVPLNVVISLGLAVWIGPKIKGRQAFRVLLFIPVMTPMVANVMVGGCCSSRVACWTPGETAVPSECVRERCLYCHGAHAAYRRDSIRRSAAPETRYAVPPARSPSMLPMAKPHSLPCVAEYTSNEASPAR